MYTYTHTYQARAITVDINMSWTTANDILALKSQIRESITYDCARNTSCACICMFMYVYACARVCMMYIMDMLV